MRRVEPGPGQESVWDYPRPPRAEAVRRRAIVTHGGTVVADTDDVVRVLETSHPPTWYLPRTAFTEGVLRPAQRRTVCEWKGTARYVDIVVPGVEPLRDVGWWYPEDAVYPVLADRVALYPAPFDEITLDGERVEPQPGGFYGGWITADVVGPFKGSPGTWGW
ncbi:DUF427 domain-containing protein [Actinomycetospora callitridis]|uniref:DUF427 domain-containing protein n=1 Tax=Actinomycetospora callitridis TaxID=913944 RepID=UPI0023655B25|nr:DUF427 domain-containing protein [Actinomycetospora callitridis]MDD7921357.1 DUF427 domain-containing protein [Actinomycetospora callitridis]